MNIGNSSIQSINRYLGTVDATQRNDVKAENSDFSSILSRKLGENRGVKISKHAATRLEARNINLSNDQVERLKTAVDKASGKGIRDSLVVLDDMAFVVNVPNRTVITAANRNELKENVFTNIDGAVFT